MEINSKPLIRIDRLVIVHAIENDETMGVYVEAEVSYEISHYSFMNQNYMGDRRIEFLKSGGLWGIDVGTSFDEIVRIEKEQIEDLKTHLLIMGVDVSNISDIKIEMRQE